MTKRTKQVDDDGCAASTHEKRSDGDGVEFDQESDSCSEHSNIFCGQAGSFAARFWLTPHYTSPLDMQRVMPPN